MFYIELILFIWRHIQNKFLLKQLLDLSQIREKSHGGSHFCSFEVFFTINGWTYSIAPMTNFLPN